MKLLKPQIEKIGSNVYKLTCPRFVANYLKKNWDPEKIQVDETICITPIPGYPEQRELCFVMPVDSIGHIEEGSYEYGEYPNSYPGLAAHVSSENATYEAQHMGGSGDSQYSFVKALCDISDVIVDVMEYYGLSKYMYVSKLKEGTKNVYESKNVGTLASMSYCENMIPMNAATQVIIWGTYDEFTRLNTDTSRLEPRDVDWFVDALFSFAFEERNENNQK